MNIHGLKLALFTQWLVFDTSHNITQTADCKHTNKKKTAKYVNKNENIVCIVPHFIVLVSDY